MKAVPPRKPRGRFEAVSREKSGGATYTPAPLADFVSRHMLRTFSEPRTDGPLRILDPALGEGQLVVSLLARLAEARSAPARDGEFEIHGFETDDSVLRAARKRLRHSFPNVALFLEHGSFLDYVIDTVPDGEQCRLFGAADTTGYDLIIANPPYVRTQVMGAEQARLLARQFDLVGRVDLYQAFMLGICQMLGPRGIAGIIVSNRFMFTRSGAAVRRALVERFNTRRAWDLGDTRIFSAAVLPAVLLVAGANCSKRCPPSFSSIYETSEPTNREAADVLAALHETGVVQIPDGRRFRVEHGSLNHGNAPDGIWRVETAAAEAWLAAVAKRTHGTFGDIGKIRVGIKTCADKVFIRDDWDDLPTLQRPELLRALTTHRTARRFRAAPSPQLLRVLYPHEVVNGRRRAVQLRDYPRTSAYLESHRSVLEARGYVTEARREWYEIWVPQDPNAWDRPKLIFRDISEKPTFWMDFSGSVVNGDCYWLTPADLADTDLLWLALAVGNSSFIERFYDLNFNNRLYAGRRRFITQYVEKFPLPDPRAEHSRAIITLAKRVYECAHSEDADPLVSAVDALVSQAFADHTLDP